MTAFVNGVTTSRRSSRVATASTLADTQMELYRALTYSNILLDTTSIPDLVAVHDRRRVQRVEVVGTCSGLGLVHPAVQREPHRHGPDHGTYRGRHLHRLDDADERPDGQAGDDRRERQPEPRRAGACRGVPRSSTPRPRADGRLRLQRDQRRGPRADGRGARSDARCRARAAARARPARRHARGAAGERRGGRSHRAEEDQAEVAPGLLAPVRDDDRRGPEHRHRAVDPRAADRRQVPGRS